MAPRTKAPPSGGNVTPLVQPTAKLSAAYLDCHSEGHQWHHQPGKIDPLQAEPGMRSPFSMQAVGRRSHCTSCGAERIRWYTRYGEVVNRYRYSDGYLHKRTDPDDVAPSRLEWRQQLVTTLFDELGKPTRKRAAS
jgi:hypothetical protein